MLNIHPCNKTDDPHLDTTTTPPTDYMHHGFYRFSHLLLSLISFLHWAGYAYLIRGVYKFFRKSITWSSDFVKCLRKSTQTFVEKKRLKLWLVIGFFLIFLVISIIPPILGMIYSLDLHDQKCHVFRHVDIEYAYNFLTIVAHFSEIFVRGMMAVAAAICGTLWLKIKDEKMRMRYQANIETEESDKTEESGKPGENEVEIITTEVQLVEAEVHSEQGTTQAEVRIDPTQPNISVPAKKSYRAEFKFTVTNGLFNKDWNTIAPLYHKQMVDYKERTEVIKSIHKIFHSWILIQLIYYYIRLLLDLVHLVRPWLLNHTETMDTLVHAHIGLYCVYDILALVTPYIIALQMNTYLNRYIKKRQRALEEEAAKATTGSYSHYALSHSILRIEKIDKSEFNPKIPITGINIPLQGQSFIIGVAISALGLVAALVSMSV